MSVQKGSYNKHKQIQKDRGESVAVPLPGSKLTLGTYTRCRRAKHLTRGILQKCTEKGEGIRLVVLSWKVNGTDLRSLPKV